MARRWLKPAGVAALLLVAGVIAVIAYLSLETSPLQATSTPQGSGASAACSPAPCLDVQDFTLWVSGVTVSGDLVRMQVRFKNSSSATHASPEDLELIDHANHSSGLVTDASGCNTWTRHEFNNGATFGPIQICFRVTTATQPFTLRWTPDMGFFCCDSRLPISAT